MNHTGAEQKLRVTAEPVGAEVVRDQRPCVRFLSEQQIFSVAGIVCVLVSL